MTSADDLPAVVTELCARHRVLLEDALPGLMVGQYLHGSLGFGEFHPRSDVDFVITCSRPIEDSELDILARVHSALSVEGQPEYDGFYVEETDLARSPVEVERAPGILHGWFDSGGVHAEVAPITWRELRDHGVTVHGPPLDLLEIASDDEELLAATRANLESYWRPQVEAISHHPREAALPQAADWFGLGAPRLLHLLETGRQTSKSGAGRWARERFPQHREILTEGLRAREDPDSPSTYDGQPDRRRSDLLALLVDVLDQAPGP